jgi:hypothetical protein
MRVVARAAILLSLVSEVTTMCFSARCARDKKKALER